MKAHTLTHRRAWLLYLLLGYSCLEGKSGSRDFSRSDDLVPINWNQITRQQPRWTRNPDTGGKLDLETGTEESAYEEPVYELDFDETCDLKEQNCVAAPCCRWNRDLTVCGFSETFCPDGPDQDGGWSEWTPCQADCGTGVRRRECNNPVPAGTGTNCEGAMTEECEAEESCESDEPGIPDGEEPQGADEEQTLITKMAGEIPAAEGAGVVTQRMQDESNGKLSEDSEQERQMQVESDVSTYVLIGAAVLGGIVLSLMLWKCCHRTEAHETETRALNSELDDMEDFEGAATQGYEAEPQIAPGDNVRVNSSGRILTGEVVKFLPDGFYQIRVIADADLERAGATIGGATIGGGTELVEAHYKHITVTSKQTAGEIEMDEDRDSSDTEELDGNRV